jgi:CheY-like chemotaxis protein
MGSSPESLIQTKKGANHQKSSRRILIIEDNADGRESLRVLLKLLGHEVVAAADGSQGVIKALTDPPEIALIDIGLPGIDGYEVARRLRRGLGNRIFLIAQTAYADAEHRRRAYDAGFDVHMAKPLDLEKLLFWLRVARPTTNSEE